jgi:hypothetical protein
VHQAGRRDTLLGLCQTLLQTRPQPMQKRINQQSQSFRDIYGSLSRPYADTSYRCLESPPKTSLFGGSTDPHQRAGFYVQSNISSSRRGRARRVAPHQPRGLIAASGRHSG